MIATYIILAPLFGLVLFDRIRRLTRAIKTQNYDRTKVHILFLSLIVIVGVALLFLIRSMDSNHS